MAKRLTQDPQSHALYRFFGSGGTLLYIGITNSLPRRLGEHHDTKAWWTGVAEVKVEHYPSREAVLEAERRAIIAEHPLYNDKHNRNGKWPSGLAPATSAAELIPICMGCRQQVEAGDGTLHIVMAEATAAARARAAGRETRQAEDIWGFIGRDEIAARWLVHCDFCNPHDNWTEEDGFDPCSGCYSIGLDRVRTWSHLIYWTLHLRGKNWFEATNWFGLLADLIDGSPKAAFISVSPRAVR